MAEAAVANRFFCHSCSRHFGLNSQDLVCPHCESGFVEEVDASTDSSSDVEVERPSNDRPSALDMLRGSLMHYWPSSESPLAAGYDDPGEGVAFFQFNIPSNSSGATSSTSGQGSSSTPTGVAGGGARPRMPERYNLRQRTRPNPTNRTNTTNTGASTSQVARGNEEVNFLLEGFLQHLLSGTTPTLMFGSTATVQGQGAALPPMAPPWGMFTLHGNPGDYAWGANGLDNVITQLLGQLDSTGPPPAAADTIAKLPTVDITSDMADGKKECSVCMEAFANKDKAKKLPCAHLFHIPCIDNWLVLHNTCPICRKNVEHCLPPGASTSGVYYPDGGQQ